jgi:predicted phosphoribosyltransferase
MTSSIIENPGLRNQTRVFQDREEAGVYLAKALEELRGQDAILLAIPSGYTMMVAAIMVRKRDPAKIILAVPTAPLNTMEARVLSKSQDRLKPFSKKSLRQASTTSAS